MGILDTITDVLGSFGTIATAAAPIIIDFKRQEFERDLALARAKNPVFAPQQRRAAQPINFGGFNLAAPFQTAGLTDFIDIPGMDIAPQGGARLFSPFVPSCNGSSASPQPFVANNPVTGKSTWFKPAGRPILWSGDLTACKRVNKIARRAKRARR